MGCQSSLVSSELSHDIRVNILDSNFMKNQNDSIRQKMKNHSIQFQVYFSVDAFIEDMVKIYTNQLITTQDKLQSLIQQLKRYNFSPNIYVLVNNTSQIQDLKFKYIQDKNITFYLSYDQIIGLMKQKTQKTRRASNSPQFNIKNLQKVSLKIFQNIDDKSSQMMIFQQTLKSKGINYKKYNTFNQLQQSMLTIHSKFIVTDYVYHRQVINLTQIYKGKQQSIHNITKVICYCQGNQQQKYDQRLYYVTNNYLQIGKQIQSEERLKQLIPVKCSKAFMYCNIDSYLLQYVGLIESMGYEVKLTSSLEKIVKESKYYFALTIIINPEQRKQVQKYLENNDYLFKTKLVQIKKGTSNSFIGLRKVIKQFKKGYKTQKSLTRSIDIIDKHFNDTKFDSIKKQLQKNNIKVYGYSNINSYIKTKKFISPYIISNFQQRSLLLRYLNEVQFKTKIIIFCNKNLINDSIQKNKNFTFVSHHFGKILKFIKKNYVYNPYIMDENDNKIKEKKQNLKNKNKRISALNWCMSSGKILNSQDLLTLQKQFQFLNITSQTNQSNIRDIQKQSAGLFKLDYSPNNNKQKFIKDLTQSLRTLKEILKINYPQQQFSKLLKQIQQLNLSGLLKKVRQFFSSQNQLGMKLNKSLIDLSVLSKQQILQMKQLLYLINLNYLSVYSMKPIHKVKLYHYLSSNLIDKCKVGSYILNKNYEVFYQKQNQQNKKKQNNNNDNNNNENNENELSVEDKIAKYRIDLQYQYNTLGDNDLQINPFFILNNKYIFQPFSQFLIKQVNLIGDITVVTVQYKRNIDYLKAYFDDNLTKINLYDYYHGEIQKYQQNKQDINKNILLIDKQNIDCINKNMNRLQTLKLFKSQQYDKAIQKQKSIILQEQNLENFDSIKLQSLNYQLACFYFKSQKHQQCKKLVKQLLDSQPIAYLKQKIKIIWNYYQEQQNIINTNIQNNNEDQQKKQLKQSTIKNKNDQIIKIITLGEDILDYNQTQQNDKSSQSDTSQKQQNDNVFQPVCIQNQFPYIEMEQIQDFEECDKENNQK